MHAYGFNKNSKHLKAWQEKSASLPPHPQPPGCPSWKQPLRSIFCVPFPNDALHVPARGNMYFSPHQLYKHIHQPRLLLALIFLPHVSPLAHKTWLTVCMYCDCPCPSVALAHRLFLIFLATALLCQVSLLWFFGSPLSLGLDAFYRWNGPAPGVRDFDLGSYKGHFLSASLGHGSRCLAPLVPRSWVGARRRGPE